jgi:FKBP-type peptidyl-prolyl cis-trans isomerase 2
MATSFNSVMQKEKIALVALVIIVVAALSTFLIAINTNVFESLFKEKITISEGDCADVNYIGRYSSNNTIFDTSYNFANNTINKSSGTPLKVFVSFDSNATSPKAGYTSDLIKGVMKGLIGMEEGKTKTIGPIPPADGYGENKLKVGDIFSSKTLTASNYNYQLNQTLQVVGWTAGNLTLKWLNVEGLGNFTMPEGIIVPDLSQITLSPYDYLPPYYIWLDSSRITNITNDNVTIVTTPTKTKNITENVTFISTGDKVGFVLPNATTAVWNETTITIHSSPVKGSIYKLNYSGSILNITIGNITQTHINISVEYQGQSQSLESNRTISFNRTYVMRRIYVLSMMYASYIVGADVEKAGFSMNPLAGENLTFEVTVQKIYKTSQKTS